MTISFIAKPFSTLSTLELYDFLKLRAEVFIVEQNCPYQDCDDKDKLAIHLMGYEDDILVAYARLLREGVSYQGYCSIGRVVTSTLTRKKGYGKLLMAAALNYCNENFGSSIKISAQAYLEKFYQDLGFVTVSEPYLEDDIPHIAMIHNHQTS